MASAHPTIGVGIVGKGFGSAVHAPGWKAVAGAEVKAIAGRDSWRELIERSDIGLISIATPPFTHEEIASAALDAGKSVLCEKPFTLSAKSAKTLADRPAERTAIDFEFRFHPLWQKLRRLVRTESKGPVCAVDVEWSVGSWADPSRAWSWQCDAATGGGVLGALGVHTFDAIEWMFGRVRSVTATAGVKIAERTDTDGTRRRCTAEDHATVEMTLENGMSVNYVVTNVAPDPKGHRITVRCAQGDYVLESLSRRDYGKGFQLNGGKMVPAIEASTDGRLPLFTALAKSFLNSVQSESAFDGPTFASGYRTHILREAALRSAAEHRAIQI